MAGPHPLEFVSQHSSFLQAAAGLWSALAATIACGALWFAWLQVRDLRRQRNISESIEMYERLDKCLSDWQQALSDWKVSRKQDTDRRKIDHAVGRLVGLYEIVSEALVTGSFPPMARKMLRNHTRDGLCMICRNSMSRTAIINIAQDKSVYRASRLFMLKNYSFFKRSDNVKFFLTTYFPSFECDTMLSPRLDGVVLRLLLRTRLRFLGSL